MLALSSLFLNRLSHTVLYQSSCDLFVQSFTFNLWRSILEPLNDLDGFIFQAFYLKGKFVLARNKEVQLKYLFLGALFCFVLTGFSRVIYIMKQKSTRPVIRGWQCSYAAFSIHERNTIKIVWYKLLYNKYWICIVV